MSQLLEDQLKMIQEFQCPGCGLGGPDPKECSSFLLKEDFWLEKAPNFHCENHSSGTLMGGVGYIYLGLPKGFNKVGCIQPKLGKRTNNIYLFLNQIPEYNNCNVPVWAMIKDGYLFVRVYMPRINSSVIHIVKLKLDTTIVLPEKSLDVNTFYNEID